MNLRSKLALGAATFAVVGGLGFAAQAAGPGAAQPAPAATPADQAATPLTDVQNANSTLVGAQVKDNKGEAVGEVKSVQLGSDGKVASINVAVGSRTVALQASSLSYASAEKTVTSTQTKAEIQKLPPAM
jgi:hypothetical protein